jgi:hypothetical protein
MTTFQTSYENEPRSVAELIDRYRRVKRRFYPPKTSVRILAAPPLIKIPIAVDCEKRNPIVAFTRDPEANRLSFLYRLGVDLDRAREDIFQDPAVAGSNFGAHGHARRQTRQNRSRGLVRQHDLLNWIFPLFNGLDLQSAA